MAKIKVRKDIEIERNFIEKSLMIVKEIINNNRKKVLYLISAFFIFVCLSLGILWKISDSKYKQLVQFENILENYENLKVSDPEITKKTINSLINLSNTASFGFVYEMVDYIIGNLYYKEKNYKKAIYYFNKYADKSSSTMFTAIALQKAAMAAEENNEIDKAIAIYKKLEAGYNESVVSDQVIYHLGRIFYKKKNLADSRKYFNKLISSYPNSSFAEEAKKRLFLIGLGK